MATTKRLYGPAYVASSATNIYQGGASGGSSAIKDVITHIHVANVTTGAVTLTAYVGATGGSSGGTELFKAFSIAANSQYDYYCRLALGSTDFLTGLASAGSSLVVTIEGYEEVP